MTLLLLFDLLQLLFSNSTTSPTAFLTFSVFLLLTEYVKLDKFDQVLVEVCKFLFIFIFITLPMFVGIMYFSLIYRKIDFKS